MKRKLIVIGCVAMILSMTKRLATTFLMAVFLTGAVFAQTAVGTKKVKAITIRIDGFMKSKSGAI